MAFRSQKASGAFLTLATLLLAPTAFAQPELQYKVRHDHLWKGGDGTLTITGRGLSFVETKDKGHAWTWLWDDIQQLEMRPKAVKVLTYRDNRWKAGADRGYQFDLVSDGTFSEAYAALKDRLDQRFVAELADRDVKSEWEIPVKYLKRFGGSDGLLVIGDDQIVFSTEKANESRTWRFSDIENISTSGPFQLTLTTYERARMHYGDLKGFNFQLKRPLDEGRYNEIWRALNAAKSLKVNSNNNTERKDTE